MSLTYTKRIELFQRVIEEFDLDSRLNDQFKSLRRQSDIVEIMSNPKNPSKSAYVANPPSQIESKFFLKWRNELSRGTNEVFSAVEDKFGRGVSNKVVDSVMAATHESIDPEEVDFSELKQELNSFTL